MPPSTKSGVGVYKDWGVIPTTCQPCLSLDPPPLSLHSIQLFGRHSRLKIRLKRSLPAVFLTILMELDPSTILPCIVHIVRMIFPFKVSQFGLVERLNFGDGTVRYGSLHGQKASKLATTLSSSKSVCPCEPWAAPEASSQVLFFMIGYELLEETCWFVKLQLKTYGWKTCRLWTCR